MTGEPIGGERIGVVANAASGRNSREAAAIGKAMAVLGAGARLVQWDAGAEPVEAPIDRLLAEGRTTIVAAGGDGTVMAVAGALCDRDARMAVLPLGTFNFFARGLGLPEDPEAAARAVLEAHEAGRSRRIAIGEVNGQAFLNNASLGIYPAILKARETIYGRWGRYRTLAHWSVVRTFLRFQRPMRLRLKVDGAERRLRTPLLFAARSRYQLERYGLEGGDAIRDDRFAVFVAKDALTRAALFRLAWRLVTRRVRICTDVEMIEAREIEVRIEGHDRVLVAFDGEKARMVPPIVFSIRDEALAILVPAPTEEGGATPEGTAAA